MEAPFDAINAYRCQSYARFTSNLDRIHIEALYWSLFFLVIIALLSTSCIFQWTMEYRNHPAFTTEKFRKKLAVSLGLTFGIFLVATAMLVIEVFCLFGMQFCVEEPLIILYWSPWSILQFGSVIAILGVNLALLHHLCDMEHPQWALALGTPVLVVAGFGHLLTVIIRKLYSNVKTRRESSKTQSSSRSVKGPTLSSQTTIENSELQIEKMTTSIPDLENGQSFYFAVDTADDERIKKWPSFVCVADGKAIVKMTAVPEPER
ncbi:hypothetical protein F5B22DRAFT_662544 [Xylaria bambusicola]|uniref:uncharacterized protein n=1 Tax=Xylaria bambusicola TaxID=326684 RepID=UPI00200744FC|nr:uncharacterized protein F5B22DRAFT_662544 [Xylaria bambusicola]KAI0521421.1 hypothetical protein F5B22DRAFT_662544 [Xylaria bambusicola]